MKLLFKLAINNFKRYKRESLMVILSISLTISLLTLVATLITSIYASSVQEMINYNPFNVEVTGFKDSKLILEPFADDILYYELSNYDKEIIKGKEGIHAYPIENLYQKYTEEFDLSDSRAAKVLEGRDSQGRHEIVVPKGMGYKIGDEAEVVSEQDQKSRKVKVVGYTTYQSFYYKDASTVNNLSENAGTLKIIFKAGSKKIDQHFDNLNDKSLYYDNALLMYNSDYNYLLGMQNSPGSGMYIASGFAVILMLVVSFMTFSLILNALEANMSQKNQSFSVLRSIGTTKYQMRVVIFIEIGILTIISLILGIIGGVILSHSMISIINELLKAINSVEYGVSDISLGFWSPNFVYFIIIAISLLLVLIGLIVKTRSLYKASAIASQISISQNNKKRYSLKGRVIYSLAKINSKRSKAYKGIKTAIFISSIILIVLITMINIVMQVPGQTMNEYDTYVSGMNFDSTSMIDFDSTSMIDFDADIVEIETIFEKFPEIKEYVVKKEVGSLIVDFDKHKLVNADDLGFLNFQNLQTVILRDEDFEHVKDQFNLDSATKTIFVDHYEPQDFDAVAILLHNKNRNYSLGLVDGDLLYLHDFRRDKNLSIKIDAVLKDDIPDSLFVNNKRHGLYLSESNYRQYLKDSFIDSYGLYAVTDLEPSRITELNKSLNNMNVTYNLHSYSDLAGLFIAKMINQTAFVIASFLFAYIGLVIIINITNITLVSFRQRRQELASLRSIGASKQQIIKLIIYETLNIILLPYILSVILANIIAYILFLIYKNNFLVKLDLVFKINIPANILTLLLLIITLAIVYIMVKKESSKTSIIEDIKFY